MFSAGASTSGNGGSVRVGSGAATGGRGRTRGASVGSGTRVGLGARRRAVVWTQRRCVGVES